MKEVENLKDLFLLANQEKNEEIINDCNLPLNGSIGWAISLKASAIREEQIAFVGSPAPIPIKFRLNFFGTGGLG